MVPCCSNTGAGRLLRFALVVILFFWSGSPRFRGGQLPQNIYEGEDKKMYAQWLVSQTRTSSTLLIESRSNASRRRSLKRKGWGGMPFAGQSMTKWNGGGELGDTPKENGVWSARYPLCKPLREAMRRCTIIASEGEKCRRGLYKVRIVVTE